GRTPRPEEPSIPPRDTTLGVAGLPGSPGQVVPLLLVGEEAAANGPPAAGGALPSVLNLLIGPTGPAGSGNTQQALPPLQALFRAVVSAAEGIVAGWRVLLDAAVTGLQQPLSVLRATLPVFEPDSTLSDLAADVARALWEAGISTTRLLRAQIQARLRG